MGDDGPERDREMPLRLSLRKLRRSLRRTEGRCHRRPWGDDVPHTVRQVSAERPPATDPAEHCPETRRATQSAPSGLPHPSPTRVTRAGSGCHSAGAESERPHGDQVGAPVQRRDEACPPTAELASQTRRPTVRELRRGADRRRQLGGRPRCPRRSRSRRVDGCGPSGGWRTVPRTPS